MSTIDVGIKVTADSRAAVRGLHPLEASLQDITAESKQAEASLKELGDKHRVTVDDDQIGSARREIDRLRDEMRNALKADINADTREPQRKIRALRSTIKELERDQINLDVDVDDSELSKLDRALGGIGKVGSKVPGILGGIGKVAAGVSLGLSGIAVGAGAAVLGTLKLADQMAQAKIAFTQFLGTKPKADKFLADLSAFAAKTPFEFPELVESSKTLLAFGIKGEDIVGIMTSLGDAAALTGGSVGDLTTIWGQMEAKGKVANEELLQLTEHGIPAYQMLADAMGVPVSKIQEMASKGELLSNTTLPILRRKMDEAFGGGMAKQSETLSGLWSTMKDTLDGIGRSLGEAFTPVVTENLKGMTDQLNDLADWASENKAFLVGAFGEVAGQALDFAADMVDAFGQVIDSIASLLDAFDSFKVLTFLVNIPLGVKNLLKKTDFKEAADGLRKVSDQTGGVADKLREAGDQARATGDEWAKSFEHSDAITKLEHGIRDTKAQIQELEKQPPTIEVQLETEHARNKLEALQRQLREAKDADKAAKIRVRIEADTDQIADIRKALDDLKRQHPTPKVKADIKDWEEKLRKIRADKRRLEKKIEILIKPPKFDPLAAQRAANRAVRAQTGAEPDVKVKVNVELSKAERDKIAQVAKPKTLSIKPTVDSASTAKVQGTTKDLTAPRKVKITPTLHGVDKVRRTIADLTKPETKVITIITKKGKAPGSSTGAAAAAAAATTAVDEGGRLAAAAQALAAPTATAYGPDVTGAWYGPQRGPGAPYGAPPAPTQLHPKQTPVQVILDGAVIADHLDLRARNLAQVGSIRRTA